ncbi:heparan sulfate (glucosamine) 3-O-sulfotransferase 1-like 2 [Trichomycterus rosablanca]|uniref:heparan sulfate (glucosamine) 3-O-sulfotransferase 1-like 2 n=1 Tax=Trichomycterus rosablanca TaxID=2290929 RepID=UPI002F353458
MLWTLLVALILLLLLHVQLYVCLRELRLSTISGISVKLNETTSTNSSRRLPGAIIIGVRKGGTRALLEMLNLHPNVEVAKAEVHYFNLDENFRKGLDWYRAQMPLTLPGQVTVEKTPGYFTAQMAPARMWSVNPAVKLLLIVRDPAERLVSDYTQVLHNRIQQNKSYQPLEELLLRQGHININYKALQRSLYHQHLARWLKLFPKEQIHIVDGEALIRDPFPELQKAEKFLELPPRITPDNFYFNSTKGFYCLLSAGHDKCLDESKGRPHAPLSNKAFQKLCRFLSVPNQIFFTMMGRTFDWC